MGLVVPNTIEVETLIELLTPPLSLRLYSNNKTPTNLDTASSYTQVVGGGYVVKPLLFAGWAISAANPSIAIHSSQSWTFTGVTNAPGTIYGYYVVRDSDGKLMWAERFPTSLVPFVPINGSVISLLPRFSCESQF